MSLATTIRKNLGARGLAIIVTNDYRPLDPLSETRHKLSQLPGTVIDGENMKKAFESLDFVVHWEKNVDIERFQQLICEAKNFTGYRKLKNYKCIVFVFSGHGEQGDYVFMQDRQRVCIGRQIIEPFLPKTSSDMGKFQKVFLIDACRGDQNMEGVLVPKSGGGKGKTESTTGEIKHRGVQKIEMKLVPPEGGFLVAYSTMPSYRSWEHGKKGGAWLRLLAEEIQTNRNSIEDVLTKVNTMLVEKDGSEPMQQPEKLSRLNAIVYLHPDKDEPGVLKTDPPKRSKPSIAAVFPMQSSDVGTEQVTQLDQSTADGSSQYAILSASSNHAEGLHTLTPAQDLSPNYVAQLNTHCHIAKVDFRDYHYMHPQYGVTYYRSQALLYLSNLQSVVGDSQQYFVSVSHSRNEAAKDALMKLESILTVTVSSAVDLAGSTQPTPEAGANLSAPEKPQMQNISRGVPGSTYKEQMQIFFQRNRINPQFEFHSDNTTGSSRYRCVVRFTINGKQTKVDSGSYFSKKADAKEHVAKLVLSRENTSVSEATSKGTSPSKLWKSKLKEHFDKQGLLNIELKYSTMPSGGGFVSTVVYLGKQVKGVVCKSKQEAEQSAAQCALLENEQS